MRTLRLRNTKRPVHGGRGGNPSLAWWLPMQTHATKPTGTQARRTLPSWWVIPSVLTELLLHRAGLVGTSWEIWHRWVPQEAASPLQALIWSKGLVARWKFVYGQKMLSYLSWIQTSLRCAYGCCPPHAFTLLSKGLACLYQRCAPFGQRCLWQHLAQGFRGLWLHGPTSPLCPEIQRLCLHRHKVESLQPGLKKTPVSPKCVGEGATGGLH